MPMNSKCLFNDGWEFAKGGIESVDCHGLNFNPIDIPHDWLIENALNFYGDSTGWYRKVFIYRKGDEQVLLYFEGVYMDSSVYVNREFVGEWKYGYSSFEYDITDALADGENEILVKVIYRSPNSRWYTGAGIYRNVWLKKRDRNHIKTNGIYVSIRQESSTRWCLEVYTELNLYQQGRLTHTLFRDGKLIGVTSSYITVDGNQHGIKDTAFIYDRQVLDVNNPLLWSTDNPNLYQLETQLELVLSDKNRKILMGMETIVQNIGFRTITMDPEEGFSLNGKRMKLNGVCEHHDLGALGAAFNKNALRRRFQLLKEMGVNAVRTAHNMPAPELMNLADEMGIMIISEAFDMWERPKTQYDYARFFKEWARVDVRSWVLRDRNHPSLIMWSIGNEIYDTHVDEKGKEITKMLIDYVRKYDPNGNARVTIGSNYMPWENAQRCADMVEVVGYNYGEKYYRQHHEEHPDWIIYGSETASVVQSRGIYHFPFEKSILADDDEQCSSLGNSRTSWGAESHEFCILTEKNTPFSLGQFLWTGFDYIGEPTPYHTKNSYFGQLDTATFKKDSYYIYQSAWMDYKIKPMVHIFPYWDFNHGQIIDVRVCSNAPKVELQLNGSIIDIYELDHQKGTEIVGWSKIPYEEGEIKAIAYDELGRVIATDIRKSFKDAKKIRLNADKKSMVAGGTDLIFVEISMEDENGNIVENANNRVQVRISGAGRLIGLDNGDSTDYDSYKGISKRLFSGKLMAIIGARSESGKIRMEVSSIGMDTQSMEFEAIPNDREIVEGVSAQIENKNLPCVMGHADEIPLRKIQLTSLDGQQFSKDKSEIVVEARLYPENTSYKDVIWRITNDVGIDSNLAIVEPNGLKAKVIALGDGSFKLRCMSNNGTDKPKLISQLEFLSTGLGTQYKDPYDFIFGGLYDYSKGEIGNGNERGFATSRDGETQVGFKDIDFGHDGSDTITIPIFALSNEPYRIRIWEGIPGDEGSQLIGDVVYQKESIWNVYQEATYKLRKKLKGVTSICFVVNKKLHIKGFSFKKVNRAFEENLVISCDHIYGDTYKRKDDRIEGIGNNVSIIFDEMDFSKEGASRLIICGRSLIDNNTIHINFSGDNGESTQTFEFSKSEEYVKRSFNLERVTGVKRVTFMFLPGSNFDFGWFHFQM